MGKKEENQITIFDVARLAKVSRGTVDRVVYKRGRVSQKTIEKVIRENISINNVIELIYIIY